MIKIKVLLNKRFTKKEFFVYYNKLSLKEKRIAEKRITYYKAGAPIVSDAMIWCYFPTLISVKKLYKIHNQLWTFWEKKVEDDIPNTYFIHVRTGMLLLNNYNQPILPEKQLDFLHSLINTLHAQFKKNPAYILRRAKLLEEVPTLNKIKNLPFEIIK